MKYFSKEKDTFLKVVNAILIIATIFSIVIFVSTGIQILNRGNVLSYKEYSEKAKDTAYDLKDKAKVAAKDIKAKADEWKAAQEDDIFEDDEIIINDVDFSEDRDYVSIKTEEATDAVKDAVEDIKND